MADGVKGRVLSTEETEKAWNFSVLKEIQGEWYKVGDGVVTM